MPRPTRLAKGQLELPFDQQQKILEKAPKVLPARKNPPLAERRAIKDKAFRLSKLAYRVILNHPRLPQTHNWNYILHEIGLSIGAYRKGRLTYRGAQAAIGLATGHCDFGRAWCWI